MNLIAQLISIISNPFLISIPLSFALIFKSRGDASYAISWTLVSLLFTALVAGFVYWGVKKGIFSDLDVSIRGERPPLFIFASVVCILYLVLIFMFNGPRVLLIGLGSLLIGIFLANVINSRIKASIHLAVFASFSVILGILYGGIFWILLFLAPIVAWSRIKLKRHTIAETIVGIVLGSLIVMVVYYVVKYFVVIK